MPRLLKRRPSCHSVLTRLPFNGEPQTLAEMIDDEARAFRDRGDMVGQFIADHLERLAQLVRWTGAQTPEDHLARMEVLDEEMKARQFDRGVEHGLNAARSGLGSYRF